MSDNLAIYEQAGDELAERIMNEIVREVVGYRAVGVIRNGTLEIDDLPEGATVYTTAPRTKPGLMPANSLVGLGENGERLHMYDYHDLLIVEGTPGTMYERGLDVVLLPNNLPPMFASTEELVARLIDYGYNVAYLLFKGD